MNDLRYILNKVIQVSGITLNQLKSNSRKSEFVAARVLFIRKAIELGYTQRIVAECLNRDRSMIPFYIKRYKQTKLYNDYEERYNKCIN